MTLYDAIGIFGSAIIVAAYCATQLGRLSVSGRLFPALNLIGAVLILISLTKAWNLPSAIMEGFWVLISLYGLRPRRRA